MSKHIGKGQKRKKDSSLSGSGTKTGRKSITNKRAGSGLRLYVLVGLLLLAMLTWLILPTLNKVPANNPTNSTVPNTSKAADPVTPGTSARHNILFEKEGVLTFLKSTGETVKTIDIETAVGESESDQGLMYRQNLPDGQGMLFIFDRDKPQAFWMKNTYVALDIIYVNSGKKIVSIAKNAKPLSPQSLPSRSPAKYVVEVPAGFCDAYGLAIGDLIAFDLNKNAQ